MLISEGLSARRLDGAVRCLLPYGLTWEELAPCLPHLDESRLGEAEAFRTFEKQGKFHGGDNSCILTSRFPTRTDGLGQMTVFVKHAQTAHELESERYAFLARAGVPTPRLLTAAPRDSGEVLVMEFLPTIGIDPTSVAEVTELLALLARLNAVEPEVVEAEEEIMTAPPLRSKEQMDALRRAGLEALALDPRAAVDVDAWFDALERSRDPLAAMPFALTHGEFSLHQCGWAERETGRQLVLFDLATMCPRPRFADLTSVLPEAAENCGLTEIELLSIYLDFLGRHGRPTPPLDAAMRELRWFRIWSQGCALHWLTHEVWELGSDELLGVARVFRADLLAVADVGQALGPESP